MVRHRIKWSGRLTVLVTVTVAGLVTLIVQKLAYSLLSSHRSVRDILRHRVQSLREEGALMHPARPDSPSSDTHSHNKVILMHSFPVWYDLKSGRQLFSSCNHSCVLTLDEELAQEVDSVVIYVRHYKSKMPLVASPNQIWVYFAVESPFNSDSDVFGKPEWQHRFNWTMTYRRDSDFYFGYGDFMKPSSPIPVRDLSSIVKGKSKMVAWFVSNCHTQSKREDFASALKEFIDVDIYGSCGPLNCGKERNQTCLDMLSRDYYFYLSFENSMCKDYITEKLYRTMKMVDVVPVVRGGANYTALLPKDSFIDASHFPTVKALADHLKQVAGDKKLYEHHLAWKKEWKVIEPMPFAFCDLCYKLHHADKYARVYPNVETWWHQGSCYDPPAILKS